MMSGVPVEIFENRQTAEQRSVVFTNPRMNKERPNLWREWPGLYFIGEVVDVTGHLGGFNFQWAWSSGHACGEAL
jgi:siroheme synthase